MYREPQLVSFGNSKEQYEYYKPALAQMSYIMQWLVSGLAPTFLTQQQLDSMTSMQIFEECIKYITELNSNQISEDERNSLWGAALVTSRATIDYLFPAVKQCLPKVELELVTDEVLNEILTLFFTDYFSSLSTK